MTDVANLIKRAAALLDRLEALLPQAPPRPDWSCEAFRWRKAGRQGFLQPVRHPHHQTLDDLLCLERQKEEIERNTHQFLTGRSANNVLLWGSRGTGKSSLIKAVFGKFRGQGLRVVEVDKDDLIDLPDIIEQIRYRSEHFILFCDDLSFETGESGYKALKASLDGSISATPDNVLIYATSNRRHLLPEFLRENRETRVVDGEIHLSEGVEEKISLSDRFGLWISFHPFTQDQYLEIARHWLRRLGVSVIDHGDIDKAALQWSMRRGARSGRTAWQFARDWAGRRDG